MSDVAPEWLVVGAEVATLRSDRRGKPVFAKVERIGKRDVVLDNGDRFNVNRLTRSEGGSWGWTVALLPADSPVVTKAVAVHRRQVRVSRAKGACEDFRYGREGVTAADVILACAPLTGLADEIAALFATPP